MRHAKLLALVVGFVITAATAHAQVGHPAKGSWLGYYGPSGAEHKRLFLALDWKNQAIVGTINPGPNGIPIDRATLDYDTWTLTIEADMPVAGGSKARYVATGKLENLGSWINRRYSGTYRLGDETGTFVVTLN